MTRSIQSGDWARTNQRTLLLCGLLLPGCGGVGGGEYVAYRIAASEPKASGTCTDNSQDKTTFLQGGTMVMFAVSGDIDVVYHLDIGSAVLKGFASDTGFSFQGKSTDVEDMGGTTITRETTTTIAFDVDGSELSNGSGSTKLVVNCTAGQCMGFDPVNCTRTNSFTGVEIEAGDLNFSPNSNAP